MIVPDAAGQAPREAVHLVFLDELHFGLAVEDAREPAERQVDLSVLHLVAHRRTVVVRRHSRVLRQEVHAGMPVRHGHHPGEVHVLLHEVDDLQTGPGQRESLMRAHHRRHGRPVYAQTF